MAAYKIHEEPNESPLLSVNTNKEAKVIYREIIVSTLFLFFYFTFSYGQKIDYNNKIDAANLCLTIQRSQFKSENDAEKYLNAILSVIGASKRFVVQECGNINNAVAITYKGVRYILYDKKFMESLQNNSWSSVFVLAHEVGHHVNGHTVDIDASITNDISLEEQRKQELEADEFAGYVLGRLGSSLSDAQSAVKLFSPVIDEVFSTHPNTSKRLKAIEKGFKNSGGKQIEIENVKSPYSNNIYYDVEYYILDNYFEDGVYKGYVSKVDNKPFGFGVVISESGYKYEGEWSNGKKNGYGKEIYSDGTTFEGFFVNNYKNGSGVYEDRSGKAIGLFSKDVFISGTKILKNSKGKVHEGEFYDDICIKCLVKINDSIVGEYGFLDDSKGQGYATYTFFDETMIKSNFKNGTIIGNIPLHDWYWSYEGRVNKHKKLYGYNFAFTKFIPEFIRKQLNIIDPINKEAHTYGEEFLIQNVGKEIWNLKTMNSHIIKEEDGLNFNTAIGKREFFRNNNFSYIGDFVGYGEIYWKNGSKYNGYFKGGTTQKAWYGELFYGPDDDRLFYKGMWWDDKKNGYGVLKYKNGKIEEGIFKDNVFYKEEKFDYELMRGRCKKF